MLCDVQINEMKWLSAFPKISRPTLNFTALTDRHENERKPEASSSVASCLKRGRQMTYIINDIMP